MAIENVKKIAFSGFIWQMLNRIGASGVQFIIYLILARLLQPEDFGVIAIVSVFITISNTLVNSGLGTALVQKKIIDEIDYSSTLYVSFFMACVLYAIIFFAAPFIAIFYNQRILVGVLRLYAISIIFFAINGVQISILNREMKFRKIFIVSSIPIIISGIISLVMAYSGFGVYALVVNAVSSGLFSVIVFWIIEKWKPKRVFSRIRIKGLFSFSYKLLLASLLENAYKSVYPLVIGKVYNSSILGYYNYGRQIPNLITSTINASLASVAFPIYSRTQDDKLKLKSLVRYSITLSNFIIFPIMAGLSAIAKPLVILVLTEKWLPSVPYLQLFSIAFGLYHVQSINFHAISALGKSNIFLKYEIIKKIVGIILLVITIPFGIKAIVLGQVVLAIVSIVINFKPNIIWLGYSIKEQLNDIWPYLFVSAVMFFGIQVISLLELGMFVKVMVEVIGGGIIYVFIAFVLKLSGFKFFKEMLKIYL